MTLSEKQKARIQTSLASGNFNANAELEALLAQGMSQEDAVKGIKIEADAYRQKLFDQTVKKGNQEEYKKVAFFVVVMLGLAGPLFDVASLLWYIVAAAIAGGVGYWAYKETPVAGLVGSVCFVVIVPFTYIWYVSGRSSIIRIELLIPMGLAMGASYLIGFIISKIVYSNK